MPSAAGRPEAPSPTQTRCVNPRTVGASDAQCAPLREHSSFYDTAKVTPKKAKSMNNL